MSKELHCRDLGFDCEAVINAENDQDVLKQVADHAKQVHGLTDEQLSEPVLLEKVQAATRG